MNNNNIVDVISSEASSEQKTNNFKTTKFICPFCKSPIWSVRDATGIMVWCGAADCKSVETPFGHALSDNRSSDEKLEKIAFDILMQKANKSMGMLKD